MPASRKTAHSTGTSYRSTVGKVRTKNPEAQPSPLVPSRASADDGPALVAPFPKKRRPPNAFILFRSFMIANKSYPLEMNRQNDISCFVAEKWRNTPEKDRSAFFRMAKDAKRRFEIEELVSGTMSLKKKRTRTSKRLRSSVDECHLQLTLPQSALSVGNTVSPQSGCSTSAFPQHYPVSTFDSVTPCDDVAVSPSAPQPLYPIPPSLFQWREEAEDDRLNANKHDSPVFQHSPSPALFAHPDSYECDAGRVTALDAALQLQLDFSLLPTMDTSWQIESSYDAVYASMLPPVYGIHLFT